MPINKTYSTFRDAKRKAGDLDMKLRSKWKGTVAGDATALDKPLKHVLQDTTALVRMSFRAPEFTGWCSGSRGEAS